MLTASAAEMIRTRDGERPRARPFLLSAGTRLLLIAWHGEIAEVEPIDGPHEGERLLVFPEHLDL